MEVGVFACEFLRFIPHQRTRARAGAPMEFDEIGRTLSIDQPKGMDAEALHAAQAFGNGAVRHRPNHHVRRLWHQRHKVPEGVMRRTACRNLVMRLRLYGMYKVRKLDRILNEEHRHIVADQVEVAFVGEKLHSKPADITHGIAGAARPLHGRKTHKYRRLFARILQESCFGQRRMRFVGLKVAMCAGATGMHDALRNALMVKMRDLLAHDEVFQQRRASGAHFEGVLIVCNLHPLVGAQRLIGRVIPKRLEAVEFDVRVATIQGVGSGHLALVRRRFFAAHQTKLLVGKSPIGRAL